MTQKCYETTHKTVRNETKTLPERPRTTVSNSEEIKARALIPHLNEV